MNYEFTDPVLLEVLRERLVELVFGGLRPDDLRRWYLGELFTDSPMNGMYVPALEDYDLNSDGITDVFSTREPNRSLPILLSRL